MKRHYNILWLDPNTISDDAINILITREDTVIILSYSGSLRG
jgi:hypothetical protein